MAEEEKKEKTPQEDIDQDSKLGKRYICKVCGTEVLCIRAGAGRPECCGQPLVNQPKKFIEPSD